MNMTDPYPPNTLICDASRPLLTNGLLLEELILYNLSEERTAYLYRDYEKITGKSIDANTRTSELSGGQKVMLMAMLALYSPARSILFLDLHYALDEANRITISGIIERFAVEKDILLDTRK